MKPCIVFQHTQSGVSHQLFRLLAVVGGDLRQLSLLLRGEINFRAPKCRDQRILCQPGYVKLRGSVPALRIERVTGSDLYTLKVARLPPIRDPLCP